MNVKIVKSEDLKENDYGDTRVTDIINEKEVPFSIAKVRKVGDGIKVGFDPKSDVAYYVLDGEGKAIVNGKEYKLKKGDCVFYPKETKYKHLKGLKLLAISYPRFNRENRVYVE